MSIKKIKKTIFVFLMCVIIFCVAYNTKAASVRQDVNQDGQINTIDAMLTLKKSLGIDMSGTFWQDTADTGDVNCDGALTTADSQLLLKKSLGFDMAGTSWCTAGQNLTADAGVDQSILENTSATLHCTSSGADGAIIYKWMQGSTELASTQDYTTPALNLGTHTYTCVTTDNSGEVASDSVDVVVTSHESSVLDITTEGGGGDYVCNGSQDQLGINEALDRVATDATLTTVYLKGPMTCVIEEPIIISSNTKLIGDSNVKVQLKDYTEWPYNKPLIAQKGGEYWEGGLNEGSLADQIYGTTEDAISNVEISGFELTAGTQDASPGSWYYILMIFYGTSDLSVHDMHLHHSYGDFVRIQSATLGMNNKVKFYNNLMENSGHDGLYLGYISDLEIYDNKIYYTRTNDGIRVGQCDNISIHGNTVGNSLNNVPSGYAGINIDNDEVPVGSVEIYENYIYGKAGGIVLEAGSTKDLVENVHIHHNRIFKAFDNTAGGDNYLNGGIHIHGAHNTLIEFNTIEGSYKDGIVFEIGDGAETGYQTIVRNNIISNSVGYGLNNIDSDKHTFISEYNDIYNSSAGNYNNASSTTDIHADPLYAYAKSKNGWTHIVATYDSATERMKVYINGQEKANEQFSGFGNVGTNAHDISIGTYLGDLGLTVYGLNGKLDDMAVWERALTSQEVQELWNDGNGIDIGGGSLTNILTSYWKMENNWNDEITTHGAVTSTASFSSTAQLGAHSGLFERTTYTVLPDDFSPSSALSISTWVYMNNGSGEWATIFNKGDQSDNNHIWLYAVDDNVFFELGNGTIREDVSASLAVDPETSLDLHLKSEHGRWNGQVWAVDSETSPAIDQGKPSSDYSNEPSPNGGKVNLGTYGNTNEASKS